MEMFRSGCEPVPTKCKLFITSRSLVCGEQVGTFARVTCNACKVCVQMYSCSCVDYALHYTACNHIQLVHTTTNGSEWNADRQSHESAAQTIPQSLNIKGIWQSTETDAQNCLQ